MVLVVILREGKEEFRTLGVMKVDEDGDILVATDGQGAVKARLPRADVLSWRLETD